jgi:hypothetical protein
MLLSLLKIDYRFVDNIYCCGDDHDYFMHSETIAVDFDFDYKNQMIGIENKRYNQNGKIAPTGFLGSGLLASPFLFIGNHLSNIFPENKNSIYNFKILFYSFSAIFYLLFSLIILRKLLDYKNYKLILISVFGSGITYYAFERYSMTHIYEFFTVALVMLCCKLFYKSGSKKYAVLIPATIMLAFLVRWVNYFILFIPLIISFYEGSSKYKLTKSLHFYFSSFISFSAFLWFSNAVYGIYTFNPQKIYGKIGLAENLNIFSIQKIFNYLVDFLKINFSQEFGVLWFNPPIFFSLVFIIINLVNPKRKQKYIDLISLLCILSMYGLIIIWGSTGSSYGFRYLYGLLPISIYILVKNNFTKNFYFKYFFILLCLFSFSSTLFFETTELTQLSLVEENNVFGNSVRFTEPEYLKGYIFSLINLDSYLKIVSTSFIGVASFKILLYFYGKDSLIEFLSTLGLPSNNADFLNLLDKLELISFTKISFSIVFIIIFIYSLKLNSIIRD